MSPVGGVSPGTVAVYYGGGELRATERRLKAAELALRCAITVFGVLTASLTASNAQTREFFSLQRTARFTDMKALVFMVATTGVVAGLSLIHVLRCAFSMAKGSVLLDMPLAWAIFSVDQAMAYLTLAAVSAAMQASVLGKFGQPELQWMKVCDLYAKFCKRGEEGLVCAVLVCVCMVVVSSMSAFNLFRLYGKSKGSKSSDAATSW
ncbi:CASP-like protein 2B1 [Curcuma longa]|uniref:CASP-like protein 2B1 n=1 Tax=Curcuma longa TaxID=136217 RepID=UPI003D9E3C35